MQKLALIIVFCCVAFADEVLESLKQRCRLGNAESCSIAGFIYEDDKNYLKAKEYYEKACDMDYADGCLNLGMMYANGVGIIHIIRKFFAIKDCDADNNKDCVLYDENSIEQDDKKAKEYLKKACDLGNKNGCNEYKKLVENGL